MQRKQWHTDSSLNSCQSPFIPERLKWNDRPVISFFDEREYLYWRLHPEFKDNLPFEGISLREISFNRSGVEGFFSNKEDVLYQEDSSDLLDWRITTLSVKHLSVEPDFRKTISEPACKDNVDMCLIHDPLPCNYSHSMVVFFLNGTIRVVKENYDETLNAKQNIKTKKSV